MQTWHYKSSIKKAPAIVSQLFSGHVHTASYPPIKVSPHLLLYIRNLHPSLCLECLTHNHLPRSSYNCTITHQQASLSFLHSNTSAPAVTQSDKNKHFLYILRYKAYSIHYTVKCDILCKEDHTIILWTLFSEKERKIRGNTVVAIWYWHFTCAIHKRCYHKSVSHILAKKLDKMTNVPISKTLSFCLFPLKVDTNNRQLALVKWNNVFVFSIQFIQK